MPGYSGGPAVGPVVGGSTGPEVSLFGGMGSCWLGWVWEAWMRC
jgi:hypothetical protein